MTWIYMFLFVCLTASILTVASLERDKRASGKKCPRITNFNGRVKYRRRGTRAVFRCSKGFDRYGNRVVNCRSDNTWSGEPPVCIKSGCVPIDIQHLEKLDMTEKFGGALLSFACEDDYNLIGIKEIYCDSKVWSAPPPVCKAPTQLTKCSFEKDLCGWTQDNDDDLDWSRHQGQTSTGGTGPKTDHTLRTISGHYMFVESSNPAKNGDLARLMSPVYPTDMGDMCFEFWYHILGPVDTGHVGSLEIYILGESEFLDDLQPVFVKTGNQGDVWKRGDIYIDKRDEPYQIVIATVRKLSYISDIAIDDVRLYNCTGTTTTTSTTETETETTTTTSTSTTSSSTYGTSTLSASEIITTTTEALSTKLFSLTTTSLTTKTMAPTPAKELTSNIITPPVETSTLGSTPVINQSMPNKTVSNLASAMSSSESPLSSSLLSSSSILTTPTLSTTASSASAATSPKSTTISVPKTVTATIQSTQRTATQMLPSTTITSSIEKETTTASSSGISTSVSSSPSSNATTTVQTVSTAETATTAGESSTTARVTTSLVEATSKAKQEVVVTSQKQILTNTVTKSTKQESSKAQSRTLSTTSSTSTQSTSKEPAKLTTAYKRRTTTNLESSTSLPTTRPKQASVTSITPKSTHFSMKTPDLKTTHVATLTPTAERNYTTTRAPIGEQHPADETLKPLMIGLGVGIICGLIIIGVIAYVCVRRRKFYTSRYEDELKPITKSSSNENFNTVQYEYHDDEYDQ